MAIGSRRRKQMTTTTPALPCNVEREACNFEASPPVPLPEFLNPSVGSILLCIDSASHEHHEAALQSRRIGMLPNYRDLARPMLPPAVVCP